MNDQEGLGDEMAQYLRPGESVADLPVRWLMPPWSVSFPKSGTSLQHEIFGADSNLGWNVWALKWEAGRRVVGEHHLWPFQQMSSLSGRTTKRNRGGLFHPVEAVVLLKVWDRTGTPVFCESRYTAAEAQVLRIRDGITAAERTRKTRTNRAGIGSLAQVEGLHRQGALNDDEWNRVKEVFLGSAGSTRTEALEDLDRLWSLYRLGAVSEYEFKRKKLELLTW